MGVGLGVSLMAAPLHGGIVPVLPIMGNGPGWSTFRVALLGDDVGADPDPHTEDQENGAAGREADEEGADKAVHGCSVGVDEDAPGGLGEVGVVLVALPRFPPGGLCIFLCISAV